MFFLSIPHLFSIINTYKFYTLQREYCRNIIIVTGHPNIILVGYFNSSSACPTFYYFQTVFSITLVFPISNINMAANGPNKYLGILLAIDNQLIKYKWARSYG